MPRSVVLSHHVTESVGLKASLSQCFLCTFQFIIESSLFSTVSYAITTQVLALLCTLPVIQALQPNPALSSTCRDPFLSVCLRYSNNRQRTTCLNVRAIHSLGSVDSLQNVISFSYPVCFFKKSINLEALWFGYMHRGALKTTVSEITT